MNVLVTGANGLLGHHVVMELLKRQHTVHIIVRSTKNICFDLQCVKLFEGDFTDHSTLTRAARGCNAIIHMAAVTDTRFLKYEDYRMINVDGVLTVLKIVNELNINTLVYISSSNTIGYGNEQQLADERFSIEYPFTESFYAQSKSKAERLVLEASAKPHRHFVIIHPSFMIGAFDTKPSSGKLLLMGYRRSVMFVPKGGKNFVAASAVATAVCNALTMGRNGEKFLASGINLSFKEYYTLQKQIGNYRQKIYELHGYLVLALGRIGDLLRILGIHTDLCTMNLRQLMVREYYSNNKAKEELNLPDTDIKVAIKEAIDWFKEHHMT